MTQADFRQDITTVEAMPRLLRNAACIGGQITLRIDDRMAIGLASRIEANDPRYIVIKEKAPSWLSRVVLWLALAIQLDAFLRHILLALLGVLPG